MNIQTADEARHLAAQTTTLEAVLEAISFAASRGYHTWLFPHLPPDVQLALVRRGFEVDAINSNNFTSIKW